MCNKCCKLCNNWGPDAYFDDIEKRTYAECRASISDFKFYSRSYDGTECKMFTPKEGEPLGTGLSKLWAAECWMDEASYLHDFRYDYLPPDMTGLDRDKEWLSSALSLANSKRQRLQAYTGYNLFVRPYGILHDLFN